MCLVLFCEEKEKVVATQKAPGSCPYCGGVVMAIDVESTRSLFCLRICLLSKRKFSCTRCSRHLVSTIYDQ
ncbi:uncharacterized protein LOC109720804 [Ananas comosus]|uniref:Uncharacterized protein LOC109720804 n=1 Tax=Ananas comosus TaxID=4615 RepID=A0A6P5G7C9_ANACO|nr:uncharacterized protein LOC109720804 [Ananas comosus]